MSTPNDETVSKALADVCKHIDDEELVELALALGNLDSPTGMEGAASDHVFHFLEEAGLSPRRLALYPERANVVGRIPGQGEGQSLMLNSHLDTAVAAEEILSTPHAADREFHEAWREGDYLIGNGIVNKKGIMATWMIAAKAIKASGVRLAGDLVTTNVVGEIGVEPVDEFQPPQYIAKEAGMRYVVNRGVSTDVAVIAEGTDFNLCWVEAGKAFFRINVLGDEPPIYTPYLPRPTSITASPNAIVRATAVIEAIEKWAESYEQKHIYVCDGGTVVPKASIGAIRSGVPYKITKTPSICQLFLDVRIVPGQSHTELKRDLANALSEVGVPVEIEPYVYRRGYEAQGVEPLVSAVEAAHARVFDGGTPGRPITAITSMWRDSNVLNEVGIPTVVYGPGASSGAGHYAMKIEDMKRAARVYAAIALEVCGVID